MRQFTPSDVVDDAVVVRPRRQLQCFGVGALAVLAMGAVALALMWSAWPPRLDIGLGGGRRLVYSISSDLPPAEIASRMALMVETLERRIRSAGVDEAVVRPYGDRQIEILLPRLDPAESERLKSIVAKGGVIEFRIVVNPQDPKYQRHVEAALDPDQRRREVIVDPITGDNLARWVKLGKETIASSNEVDIMDDYVSVLGVMVRDADTKRLVIPEDTPLDSPSPILIPNDVSNAILEGNRQLDEYLESLASPVLGLEILVAVDDGCDVTGADLEEVSADVDSRGYPAVGFVMADDAGPRFGMLTSENTPDPISGLKRRLGILLDGALMSAPNLHERIVKYGEITGGFSHEDVQELVAVLRAGSLPLTLHREPVVEELFSTDPSAWRTLRIALGSGLGLAFLGGVAMAVRWGPLGALAAVASIVQFLLAVAMLMMIEATISAPLLGILVGVALLTIGCHAILCRAVYRSRTGLSALPAYALTMMAIFGVSCWIGLPIYAVGGHTGRLVGMSLIACSLAAIVMQTGLGLLAVLYSLWDSDASP